MSTVEKLSVYPWYTNIEHNGRKDIIGLPGGRKDI